MRVHTVIKAFFYFAIFFFLWQLVSCKAQEEYIPYVPVNFTVDLNRFNDLTSTGFSMKYPYDGYGGVIIYCEYYDLVNPSNSLYHAFDATCTFEVQDSCSVENEGNNLRATCPCCGSTYTLYDGYPTDGEAFIALKSYNISILGNKLYISN
ncbi:MAG: Rieske (2Fe-2S) protein [Prolixibacteraceae bacterium]